MGRKCQNRPGTAISGCPDAGVIAAEAELVLRRAPGKFLVRFRHPSA